MKKWYQWFYLSIAFAVGGFINYLDGKGITSLVIQVGITIVLAFIQFLCDKKGEKGKKAFHLISISIILFLIGWIIYLLINTFA